MQTLLIGLKRGSEESVSSAIMDGKEGTSKSATKKRLELLKFRLKKLHIWLIYGRSSQSETSRVDIENKVAAVDSAEASGIVDTFSRRQQASICNTSTL